MTSIAQAKFQSIPRVQSRLSLEDGMAVGLLGITFALRITNLNYNTLFVDEAVYATIGNELLAGQNLQTATSWMFGSQLYPVVAALSNNAAGIIGLRGLSAVLSTIAALFVFLAAQRVFNIKVALWALFIFGLTGSSISIGQHATYDVMGVFFLAIALFGIVSAALTFQPRRQRQYLLFAGAAFTLSFLSKYIALIYLPTLTFAGCILFIKRGKSIRPVFTSFLMVVAVVLAAYTLYFLTDLKSVFSGESAQQIRSQAFILRLILEEIGPVMLLATAGAVLVAYRLLTRAATWRSGLLAVAAIGIALVSTLTLPAYHLISSNLRALEKHTVYTLVFIAPLAGCGIYLIIHALRTARHKRMQVVAAIVTIAMLLWFTNHALERNWKFQNSWPNVSRTTGYLRQKGITEDSSVLASGAPIYEYDFNFGIWANRRIWHSTWYMEYKNLQGVDAMKMAIADHAVDLVVLDDYYTPDLNPILEPELEAAGYRQDWQDHFLLASGDTIRLRVYVPSTQRDAP